MTITLHSQPFTTISFFTFPDTVTRDILRCFRKKELVQYLAHISGFTRSSWTKDRIIDELLCFDNLSMVAALGT